jgi:hypothetical protein
VPCTLAQGDTATPRPTEVQKRLAGLSIRVDHILIPQPVSHIDRCNESSSPQATGSTASQAALGCGIVNSLTLPFHSAQRTPGAQGALTDTAQQNQDLGSEPALEACAASQASLGGAAEFRLCSKHPPCTQSTTCAKGNCECCMRSLSAEQLLKLPAGLHCLMDALSPALVTVCAVTAPQVTSSCGLAESSVVYQNAASLDYAGSRAVVGGLAPHEVCKGPKTAPGAVGRP